MTLGILTTTHIASPTALGSLRLLVDSIRTHIERDEYKEILIADDCSPSKGVDYYYEWLERTGAATVYKMGPPGRHPFWGGKYGAKYASGSKPNHGHAVGLMAGFWALRERGCTHALVIDSDCVVLGNGFLRDAMWAMATTGSAVATDYFCGEPDDEHLQYVDIARHCTLTGDGKQIIRSIDKSRHPGKASWVHYGFPVMFCALVDLSEEVRFGAFHNAGWVNNKWGLRLWRAGRRVAYFPFFQRGYVFHLGFGFTSPNINTEQPFGNLLSTPGYGGKERGYHHAGYLQLDRQHQKHASWLKSLSVGPFDKPATMPRGWLVSPGHNNRPADTDIKLRPLWPEDLDALRDIDTDADTVRFMQWGPHSADKTKEFVARAIAEPMRWWALSNRQDELIGYGETKPLDNTDTWQNACGITYVIHPAHRRKGHGAALLNHLIEVCYNQLDCEVCVVRIDTENAASLTTLHKRHDFSTDWHEATQKDYLLRGVPRKHRVFMRRLPVVPPKPICPPDDYDGCLREREQHLFVELGVWRP